jgi:hypothetical protein
LITASFRVIKAQFGADDPRYLASKKRHDEFYALWGRKAPDLP